MKNEALEMKPRSVALAVAGVGGRDPVLLMEVLALAAGAAGEEVRTLAQVSLARLGGAGICHLRLGPGTVARISPGQADILLALEMSEVLRLLPLARVGAQAFVSGWRRPPIAAGMAGIPYPSPEAIAAALHQRGVRAHFLPPALEARGAADQAALMLLLGFCCGSTRVLPRAALEEAIAARLGEEAVAALQAFATGWCAGEEQDPLWSLDKSQKLR